MLSLSAKRWVARSSSWRVAGTITKPRWVASSAFNSADFDEQPRATKFLDRLPSHNRGTLESKQRHDGRDNEVGPAGTGAEHAERCEQHGEISKHIVARANPGRLHV